MSVIFQRTEWLLGSGAMEKLQNARVAVFGVGGVGGYVVEALARSGVGELHLIDDDTVSESNINRQIIALHSTIGQYKTDVAAARVNDINPNCKTYTYHLFFTPETANEVDFSGFDYVVDAIDTVAGKIEIIARAKAQNIPVISSMGAGNKLNATAFEVADISKTSVCPLARTMRKELKSRGIENVKVVYSKEEPIKPQLQDGQELPAGKKSVPGSIAFVPSVVGLIVAGEVIKDLIK